MVLNAQRVNSFYANLLATPGISANVQTKLTQLQSDGAFPILTCMLALVEAFATGTDTITAIESFVVCMAAS
jgi:hypothetical protein